MDGDISKNNRKLGRFHAIDRIFHIQGARALTFAILPRHATLTALCPTIRDGETYALDRGMTEADALAYWLGDDRETFVAEENGELIGTYYIRTNQAGGGKHICNCGYMTTAAATGRGVARAMCQHSLDYARQRGYRGMQFNFVVSTTVNIGGALVAAQAVAPKMSERGLGTILLTGGGFALQPLPDYLSLSIGKAGIRALAMSDLYLR